MMNNLNQAEIEYLVRNNPFFEMFFDTDSFRHMMTFPYAGALIAFFLTNKNEIDAQITEYYSTSIDKIAISSFINIVKRFLKEEVQRRNL